MSARSKPLAITMALAVTALGLGVVTSVPVAAAAPVWETTFRDDFSGSGLPNPSELAADPRHVISGWSRRISVPAKSR